MFFADTSAGNSISVTTAGSCCTSQAISGVLLLPENNTGCSRDFDRISPF
jgi:hypothetical protein